MRKYKKFIFVLSYSRLSGQKILRLILFYKKTKTRSTSKYKVIIQNNNNTKKRLTNLTKKNYNTFICFKLIALYRNNIL